MPFAGNQHVLTEDKAERSRPDFGDTMIRNGGVIRIMLGLKL